MKHYRLKKEAVPFFAEKIVTKVLSLDEWENYNVEFKALEEVKPVYLTCGIPMRDGDDSAKLSSGWNEKGSRFHFTVNFPSVKFREHDKFNKDRMVRDMMNRIQQSIDDFYLNFSNETAETEEVFTVG